MLRRTENYFHRCNTEKKHSKRFETLWNADDSVSLGKNDKLQNWHELSFADAQKTFLQQE